MSDLRPRAGKAVEQFSFIDALVVGLFDGAFTAADVVAAGDLGLGCGDALDGEVVLIDGVMTICRADGTVAPVAGSDLLPFAEVVRFEPTFTTSVDHLDEVALEALIDSLLPSTNLFYAVRLVGSFERMSVRDASRQQHPFPGLAEAVKTQRESTVSTTTGAIVGFSGPDVFQGLSVADFHLHYLDDAREFGGHVTDFVLTSGELAIEAYSTFTVHLPQTESYLKADLDDLDADAQIRAAEG
jgi:acetolactate decarboxylase